MAIRSIDIDPRGVTRDSNVEYGRGWRGMGEAREIRERDGNAFVGITHPTHPPPTLTYLHHTHLPAHHTPSPSFVFLSSFMPSFVFLSSSTLSILLPPLTISLARAG